MVLGPPEARLADAEGLDARVLTALQGLSGRLAFSGLRRVLGAHPASLSRSLRRLAREGLIEKVDGAYRALAPPPRVGPGNGQDLRPMASVEISPDTEPRELLGRLAGRWFGTLRWVGLLERPEGELLAWSRREGGGLVLLGLTRGRLLVFAPAVSEERDPGESEDAAYELLYHALEALRALPLAGPTVSSGLRAFRLGPSSQGWAG